MWGKGLWANGWRKIPLLLWCDRSTSYEVMLLLYGRIFYLHQNGIYAMLSQGKSNNNDKGTCSYVLKQ